METTINNQEWETVQPKSDNWDFDTSPILEGEFMKSESHFSQKNNRDFFIHFLWVKDETGEGREVKVIGSKILDARFANCEIGTYLKITFLGFKMSGGGNEYRDYLVEKRKENLQLNYRDTTQQNPTTSAQKESIVIDLPEEKEEINLKDIPF